MGSWFEKMKINDNNSRKSCHRHRRGKKSSVMGIVLVHLKPLDMCI